ncbi:uncharacterized protein LOC109488373 isoform X3 [Ailuropoda melanoleuca]|uniref:uncharacterized protein LOC109488373 isoform X3 n=1 Tax=Ailuropoda melanoleuca TaxID=9646 RepID=UPI000947CA85|nr:uncharacterized protein LOC109488373 isoform X3 [Ailuropoda melanoleuca]
MFQRPQPHHNSTQPDVLPAAPSNPQKETQGSLPVLHNRRVSIQEPLLANSRWAGIQNTPSIISSRRVSTEDTAATISGHRVSIQDAPSVTFSRRFNTRDVPPIFEIRYFSIQNSPLTTRNSLSNRESVTYSSSQASSKNLRPTTWRSRLNIQGLTSPIRAKVDVPPSVTHSPTVSIKSNDSIIWTSQESFRDSADSAQINQSTLDNSIRSIQSSRSTVIDSGGFHNRSRLSHSQLPVGWRLLHQARKISRQVSLALSLLGMAIIGLISLGQPWVHFQVPLRPPGHPDGSLTMPINTILFVRCPDISCLHEYDQNAYLLDLAWAFLLLASIASFCLCILLINIIFFTSSNSPMLDFSSVIVSILAGFFSYLNYMNFWSILALQAIWT